MDFHTLSPLFSHAGAAGWGICAFADLELSTDQWEKAQTLCPAPAGVFIAAFPYWAGADQPQGNLSYYARGEDYHLALSRRLGQIVTELQTRFPGKTFVPGADNSPLPERQCARLAGLGILGRHGLVILPPYGSWVFLGTILTDLPLPSASTPAPDCPGCNACIRACPSGALTEAGCDISRCLSDLTQKKGTLTADQEAQLQAHPLIWGCDCCQLACPYNRDAQPSPLPELTGQTEETPYLASLSSEDLEGLTNRTFRAAFGNRSFAWRGPAVLRRNLAWKDGKKGDKL